MALLYDQYGREIRPEKRPSLDRVAVALLRDRWSSYPSSGLTAEQLSAIFKEADNGDVLRQSELFEEMEEKDAHLFSVLQTRKNGVLGLDWKVMPYSSEAPDQKAADFVAEVLDALDTEDLFLDLLDAIGKGFAGEELLWDIDSGRAVVRGVEWVPAQRFTYWSGSELLQAPRVRVEENWMSGVALPPWKFVLHRYKARSGHPNRAGILRTCAWMFLFKNYSLKDWMAFCEIYGMPLRLGYYDDATTPEDKDALVKAVVNLGSDAAGIISKSTEIDFVEAQKFGSVNVYEGLAKFADAQVSKAILGHTASSDATPGKLGSDKQAGDVRQDLKEADCTALARTLRRDLIFPLVGFNWGWEVAVARLPWIKFDYEPAEDQERLSKVYATLIGVGQPVAQEHISERFGIPMPQEGETPVAPPIRETQGAASTPMKHWARGVAAYRQPRPDPPDHDDSGLAEAEELADTLTDAAWERVMVPLLEPLHRMAMKAGSLDEFRRGVNDLAEGLAHAEGLGSPTQLTERAMAAAMQWGWIRAEELS